ncbi:enoyl-CoA hydratase/isomerase family protein [Tropicimonas sp. TH_r6]|uniref:enoyl-CoA hydratase/isomerase family protein n=1 Tax=Tropicimonas sp. TH_r6 TaxID=3082085 RepID=UPI002953E223|nr:enoyl-CoA hydratase/isomerase family protein [Tropicimonas sp. TH_r6]MDV7145598.1 enoyl-CoA hydratase/isomerase family protein [Tropicimonas sp. TH_r6]
MSTEGCVHLEKEGAIGHVILDRPAKHNALTPRMYREIGACCEQVNADPEIRAVVFSGAGERAFCAGSDISALEEYEDFWAWRNRYDYIPPIRALRKPAIAAIKGWALGGGLEVALACDLRVAARSATFAAPEVTLGWNGAGGAAQHMVRLCGYGNAMRYLLTGDRFSAQDALDMGMVEWLVEPGEEVAKAMEIAARIAEHNTVATQAVKSAVRFAMDHPVQSGLSYDNELMSLCFAKNDRDKQQGGG